MKTTQQLVNEVLSARKRQRRNQDWKCQECGKLMTAKQAEKAVFGAGCTRCGGTDIDLKD